jgi:pseudaminic acid synthase
VILGNKKIGKDCPPYFIAEMSGNHNHSLERALEIVRAAAAAGADALKIQTYTPDTMTLNLNRGEFYIDNPEIPWKGRTLYNLYAEAMTPWEWHEPIMIECKKNGMDFFSTPFDSTAVDFLEKLNVPFYKIASFENTDTLLLKKVAATGKPVIISSGLASLEDLSMAINTLRTNGVKNIVLLKCTSSYPAKAEDANLMTMKNMSETFKVIVGVSDHTMGYAVPITSVILGGSVIEKHFTLKRSEGGVDSAFSLEPEEFRLMKQETLSAWRSLGEVFYGITESEKKSLLFKRSLYFVKDLKKGELITTDSVRAIRPGYGLPIKYFDILIGKKTNMDIELGTAVTWDHIG